MSSFPPAAQASIYEDPRMKAFPRTLLGRIAHAMKLRHAIIDNKYEKEDGPADRPPTKTDQTKVTLWRGTCSRPHEVFGSEFAFREAADFALLVKFSEDFAQILEQKPHWVELDVSGPNPAGFALQFVGEGEVGWAEDQHGCVALCILKGQELLWLYAEKGVGDEMIPLADGNDLHDDPLVKTPEEKSAFKGFSWGIKKKAEKKKEEEDDEPAPARDIIYERNRDKIGYAVEYKHGRRRIRY